MFEIVILVRDAQGNIVYDSEGNPKKKLFTANNGAQLSDIWNRNGPHPKRRKKARAAKGKEVVVAMGDLEKYAAEVTARKRGDDEQNLQSEQEGS